MALTPMMQQYMDIKKNYPDEILFFRLGDFYEMFFDDAIVASKAMEVTLTGKSCGLEERAPMCGVPHHSADLYIARLIEKGFKVAICEQMEDPATAKGIVKREVVRVITPGTAVSSSILDEKSNNYIAAIYIENGRAALAYGDLSTGEVKVGDFPKEDIYNSIVNEIMKISPKELLIFSDKEQETQNFSFELETIYKGYINLLPTSFINRSRARDLVLRQFKVKTTDGLGLLDADCSIMALGALFAYLLEMQKQSLLHVNNLQILDFNGFMSLDKSTIRNLEITETIYDRQLKGSLLGVLDRTVTAMGGRMIKQWLREPLKTLEAINNRQDAVEVLYKDVLKRNALRTHLKQVYDLERLMGRIALGNANGRDLIALKNSIYGIPDIKEALKDLVLENHASGQLAELETSVDSMPELYDIIDRAIEDDAPVTIREGGLIKNGYSRELDDLRHSIKDGKAWIAGLEELERSRTGIKNLKVGFNKVFGYYLEVTKSYYDLVPDDYIRKQTLVGSERFITPKLKEVEGLVLNGEAKINQLEYELFQELRNELVNFTQTIQKTAKAIGTLDVLLAFSEVASNNGYVKPEINEGSQIRIVKGRHPVMEHMTEDGIFVSNDLFMDREDQSFLLITGPNMSGKSTYMRQTALIVLMAQAGSFVPAEKAEIGLVDRIYTRIGASDNLSQGMSTFLVEMSELAFILNTATERSLILLDEIGRGTSTYDGLSIAWSVVEHLCSDKFRARTMFATHYHELTVLENQIKGIKNLNVDVRDMEDNIVFLHKIVEGSTSKSYGIHVAKLAGVPEDVLLRAEEKLAELEKDKDYQPRMEQSQLSLFDFMPKED